MRADQRHRAAPGAVSAALSVGRVGRWVSTARPIDSGSVVSVVERLVTGPGAPASSTGSPAACAARRQQHQPEHAIATGLKKRIPSLPCRTLPVESPTMLGRKQSSRRPRQNHGLLCRPHAVVRPSSRHDAQAATCVLTLVAHPSVRPPRILCHVRKLVFLLSTRLSRYTTPRAHFQASSAEGSQHAL